MVEWTPSIHMPKEAARLWLKVTDIGVEHLQDITIEDIYAEGVIPNPFNAEDLSRNEFAEAWDQTIRKAELNTYGWDADPWVWVFKFEKTEKP